MTISRSPPPPTASLTAGRAVASSEPSSADGAACLVADEILELLLGALPEVKRDDALEHIAECEDCRVMFAAAARALEDTGPADSPLPAGVFQAGMLVAQRYHVERFLARGGMGEVYAVLDQVLNERVALKTVRSRLSSAKAILRLKSEALLSRRIGHPHTCRIFEFGEHRLEGGEVIYFLTMELVEGETLGAYLRREGRLPVDQVRILTRQLLGGLAEAHGLGIVHRDLKSDNVMLRSPPAAGLVVDAVIMDFGLALRMDAEERLTSDSQALVGSAAYMAPEQVEGERLTASTDVYAFGIILFEMLTGQLPFRAATPASTALLRLHSPPPPPSSLRRELEPYWDEIVLGCLERTVERRFRSAREVLAALDRPQAVTPPAQRTRSGALAAALAALVLLAVLAVGFYVVGATRSPRQLETMLRPAGAKAATEPAQPQEEQPKAPEAAAPASAPGVASASPAAPAASEPPSANDAPSPSVPAPPGARGRKPRVNAGGKAPARADSTALVLPFRGRRATPASAARSSVAAPLEADVSVSPPLAPPAVPAAPSPLEPLPLDPELPE